VSHENPLLDSGGAIHNLASREEVNYKGNLLLVNGDQFLFFDEKLWLEAVDRLKTGRAVLFGIRVDKDAAYNETVTQKNKLIEIKKNTQKDREYETYSGLGLLKLDGLKPVSGISRFFETVADFKTQNIELLTPSSYEYWDFGTADIYSQSILKLKNPIYRKSRMGQFLEKYFCFEGKENLFVDLNLKAIDLEYTGTFSESTIHAKGIFQKFS
jgi:mannose-1-phosphate guanylyltransferase